MRLVQAIVTAAVGSLVATVIAAGALTDELDPELRIDLERAVDDEKRRVFKARNDEGTKNHRASHARRFRKAEDGGYKVSFTEDVALDDRMRTERYDLTLTKPDKGDWEVTERELRGTYEKLIRRVDGDEKLFRFTEFEIESEGLSAKATDGIVVADFLVGDLTRLFVFAADLSYDYDIPADVRGQLRSQYRYVASLKTADFAFEPLVLVIDCDPVTCESLRESTFGGLEPAEREELTGEGEKYLTERLEALREARRERPFSGFRAPWEPDERYLSLVPRARGGDGWIQLVYHNRAAREVTFSAKGFGKLYSYPSRATRADEVTEAAIERREDSNRRDYDLRRLSGTVSLAVEGAQHLRAVIEIEMLAKRDLDEVFFELGDLGAFAGKRSSERDPSLTVNALEDGEGNDLIWVRLGTSAGVVVFPGTVPQGSTIVLHMDFENEGSIIKHSPSYSYMDRSGWLPFVHYNDRIESYEMTVRVPDKYTPLSVGTKLREETSDGITSATWTAEKVNFPTVIFGKYISDSPKIKAHKLDGTEIPVNIYVDRDSLTSWGIRGKQLRPMAEQAVNSLNLFREIFGVDYPHGKLDLVNDLRFLAGQSPDSIVYLGSATFRGEGALQEYAKFVKTLVAHEVGHQWWGSSISPANMRNYWFVESLAEYSSALFAEALHSEGGANPHRGYRAYMEKVKNWRRTMDDANMLASVKDSQLLWSGDSRAPALYAKGPYVFHMMRMSVGQEAMYTFLSNLGRSLAGREIVTTDIEQVASRTFGMDMGWFFDQWIRGVGIPHYEFAYDVSEAEDGGWIVSGAIDQRVVMGPSKVTLRDTYYEGLVAITVLGKDRQEYPARLVVNGPETPFRFKIPSEPLEVTLNKYGEILAHVRVPGADR